MGQPQKIKPIVDEIVSRLTKGKMGPIRNHWQAVLGEEIASHATPVSIKDEKLFVEVDSSAWLQHLTMKRKEILRKLTQDFPEQSIREIRFRHGKMGM